MLTLLRLDDRLTPSASWGVPVQTQLCWVQPGVVQPDTVTVAQAGGSCRVEVDDPNGVPLVNEILFGDSFRGGGSFVVIPGSPAGHVLGQTYPPDQIIVVPGDGGGPVVAEITFTAGGTAATAMTFAPTRTTCERG